MEPQNTQKPVRLNIQNFPKQQSIFESKARYKIVVKGRRFGLTRGAANNFIQEALEGKFQRGLWVDVVNGNIKFDKQNVIESSDRFSLEKVISQYEKVLFE